MFLLTCLFLISADLSGLESPLWRACQGHSCPFCLHSGLLSLEDLEGNHLAFSPHPLPVFQIVKMLKSVNWLMEYPWWPHTCEHVSPGLVSETEAWQSERILLRKKTPCAGGTGSRLPHFSVELCMVWESFSRVQLFATLWTVALQAPLSMEFTGKNTRVGCRSLLQGIFLTQQWNLGLLHCRQILYHRNHQGSPLNQTVAATEKIVQLESWELCFIWWYSEDLSLGDSLSE